MQNIAIDQRVQLFIDTCRRRQLKITPSGSPYFVSSFDRTAPHGGSGVQGSQKKVSEYLF
jgi:hypothetical protein